MKTLKTTIIAFLALLMVSCTGKTPKSEKQTAEKTSVEVSKSEKHKYGIKSGIVEYSAQVMGMDMTQTLYFDDFGSKEATETIMDMMGTKTHTLNITRDGCIYTLDLIARTGNKQTVNPAGSSNIDFQNLTSEMEKKMNLKKLGKEEFAGKTCEKYSIDWNDMSMKGYFLVWEGIALKSDLDMGTMKMEMIAKKVQDNVNIPAEKIEVPGDIQITEQ